MKICIVKLLGSANWLLQAVDPLSFPTQIEGVEFCNPLALPHELPGPIHQPVSFAVEGHGTYILCDWAAFAVAESIGPVVPTEPLRRFLALLRYTSAQPSLPTRWSFALHIDGVLVTPDQTVFEPAGLCGLLHRASVEVPITAEAIHQAAAMDLNAVIPAWEGVLLDGLRAYEADDFRAGTLYAAIAMESMVRESLEEQNATARGPDDPALRRLLRRGGLAEALKEASVYVLGRSICDEDKPLFDRALAVYRTRNKIAHLGEPPDGADTIPLERDGAYRALETARQLARWYGHADRYYVRRPDDHEVFTC